MPKDNENKISDFDLGKFFATINTKMDDLTGKMSEIIDDFKEIHKDHEIRIRDLEANSAKKTDIKEAHDRIDKLRNLVWKITLIIAATGSGGFAISKLLGGV